VNKRRRPVRSLVPEPRVPPVRRERLAAVLLQEAGEHREPKKQDRRSKTRDLAQNVEEHPLHFFNTTPQGITWVGHEPPSCDHHKFSDVHKKWLDRQFTKARENDLNAVLDEFILAKLFICAVDSACAGVGVEVYKSPIRNQKRPYYYRLCQHFHQMVPERDEPSTLPENEIPLDKIFFQRNPNAIKKEMETTNSNPTRFYKRAFRRLGSESGMKLLRKLQKNSCMCEETDGGCKTYKDSVGQQRFWCYIKEQQRDHCIEEGVQLFWDKRAERIWSFDLCDKRGCECSNLGMLPQNPEAQNLNVSILEGNKLNYGIECKMWTTDNVLPWCYVGLSSTCADRTRDEYLWVSPNNSFVTNLRLKMQYKSSLPCDEEQQNDLRELTESRCLDTSTVVEVAMLIGVLLYLPMIVIIFKFLSNRCGDEFHLEDQFAVVLTTDEDDSEDEFVPGLSKGEASTRGARESLHPAEGADPKSGEKALDAEKSVK